MGSALPDRDPFPSFPLPSDYRAQTRIPTRSSSFYMPRLTAASAPDHQLRRPVTPDRDPPGHAYYYDRDRNNYSTGSGGGPSFLQAPHRWPVTRSSPHRHAFVSGKRSPASHSSSSGSNAATTATKDAVFYGPTLSPIVQTSSLVTSPASHQSRIHYTTHNTPNGFPPSPASSSGVPSPSSTSYILRSPSVPAALPPLSSTVPPIVPRPHRQHHRHRLPSSRDAAESNHWLNPGDRFVLLGGDDEDFRPLVVEAVHRAALVPFEVKAVLVKRTGTGGGRGRKDVTTTTTTVKELEKHCIPYVEAARVFVDPGTEWYRTLGKFESMAQAKALGVPERKWWFLDARTGEAEEDERSFAEGVAREFVVGGVLGKRKGGKQREEEEDGEGEGERWEVEWILWPGEGARCGMAGGWESEAEEVQRRGFTWLESGGAGGGLLGDKALVVEKGAGMGGKAYDDHTRGRPSTV